MAQKTWGSMVKTGADVLHGWAGVAAALCCGGSLLPAVAGAQTPSPLAEWQYSAGIALREYFMPEAPKWQTAVGIGFSFQPDYDGASTYELVPAPSFDVRYRNLAFFSAGEGLGINIFHGPNYRVGLAATYDLGRKLNDNFRVTSRRRVGPTAEAKVFGEYVVFPVVFRLDFRQALGGGYDGYIGDASIYMPVAGSREHRFVVFAGPSVMFASGGNMREFFSVTADQSHATGLPIFDAKGGLRSVKFGVSATWFFRDRWFVNGSGAGNRLLHDAARSPFTHEKIQGTFNFTLGYLFGGELP